jgi:hypothetical protein
MPNGRRHHRRSHAFRTVASALADGTANRRRGASDVTDAALGKHSKQALRRRTNPARRPAATCNPGWIKSLGYTDTAVGYSASLPALLGVVGMVVFSRRSDRSGEREWHLVVPCLLGGVGLLPAGVTLT